MIVLKHLANEFNQDPYKLRQLLRSKFGKRRRWRWDPITEAKELEKVRKFLKSSLIDPDADPH